MQLCFLLKFIYKKLQSILEFEVLEEKNILDCFRIQGTFSICLVSYQHFLTLDYPTTGP